MSNNIKKHSELHLFIDESGSFNQEGDTRLVGGVLLFGQYDDTVQKGIEIAIRDACNVHKRKYPPHYLTIGDNAIAPFVQALKNNLDRFQSEKKRELYGIVIRYKEDVFGNGSDVLAERNYDNRYLEMCRSLIEHCVFVNQDIDSRLTKNAKIHLHIGFRQFPIAKGGNIEDFETFGYKVKERTRGKRKMFFATSKSRPVEIAIMFRQTQRFRWKKSKRALGKVESGTMSYGDQASLKDVALYLADIVLGVERDRNKNKRLPHPLPILESLEYGKELEVAMQCKSYIANGNSEVLIGSLIENPFDPDDLRNRATVNKLVEEFQSNKVPFHRLYQSASETVNHPLRRDKAVLLGYLLDTIREEAGEDDLLSELYSIMIAFSAANHSGDICKADTMWKLYLDLEKQLPKLGADNGMEFQTEFRCKRAVNLIDQFQLDEASQVLLEIGTREENFQKRIAEFFGTDTEYLNKTRLGKCFSTLGQVFAFQEKREAAEKMFRNAIRCFTNQDDIEREYVYLGHLACDYPGELEQLWDEVVQHFQTATDPFEKPFVLALKLKTLLVSDDDTQILKQWSDDMNQFINDCSDDILQRHPYGMILQASAMLNADIWRQTQKKMYAERAEYLFDLAKWSFASGEKLLQLLGKVCDLRKEIFKAEYKPENPSDVIRALKSFRNEAESQGLTVPNNPNNPHRALSAIRFNYW